jgi:hypothetical protein
VQGERDITGALLSRVVLSGLSAKPDPRDHSRPAGGRLRGMAGDGERLSGWPSATVNLAPAMVDLRSGYLFGGGAEGDHVAVNRRVPPQVQRLPTSLSTQPGTRRRNIDPLWATWANSALC